MSDPVTGPAGTIGFLGVGAIGRPIAERILRHFPLIVCDTECAALKILKGGQRPFIPRPSLETGPISFSPACHRCRPMRQAFLTLAKA